MEFLRGQKAALLENGYFEENKTIMNCVELFECIAKNEIVQLELQKSQLQNAFVWVQFLCYDQVDLNIP